MPSELLAPGVPIGGSASAPPPSLSGMRIQSTVLYETEPGPVQRDRSARGYGRSSAEVLAGQAPWLPGVYIMSG